jgi:hypothetical protein
MDFQEIFERDVKRNGSKFVLSWLNNTDFFRAPASTKYHDVHPGGLAAHSVKVYQELHRLLKAYPELTVSDETIAIVSLLHDVCKADCYKVEYRNRKNEETGMWEKYPAYTFKEDFCFGGHGSKSVYLIQQFMPLTYEEAVAINCHMGLTANDWSVSDAFRAYPLAFLLHTADMSSTIEW